MGGIWLLCSVLRKLNLDAALPLRSALTWGFVLLTWIGGAAACLYKKAKAFVIVVLAALLLSGCGQALSERKSSAPYSLYSSREAIPPACCWQTKNAGEDGTHYKTASALGVTPAQALHRAEMALPGQLYYGLLELAALPPGCDWATAQELGELLYDKAQPAPELSVFVLDSADHSWAQDAAALYEDMKAVEREYALHCGLQQLFTQADGCAVPGYRADSGYNFYLMPRNADMLSLRACPHSLPPCFAGRQIVFVPVMRTVPRSVKPRPVSPWREQRTTSSAGCKMGDPVRSRQ